MKKIFKNRIIVLIILISLLSANKTEAFSFSFITNIKTGFSNITDGISNILNAIDTIIKPKIKNDFCSQYNAGITNQDWTSGEFRTSLGELVCSTGTSSISSSTKKVVKTSKNSTSTEKVEGSSNSPILGNLKTDNLILDKSQIIYWTNINRNNNGELNALIDDQILDKIAEKRVDDMFAKSYFEHVSPSGDDASKEADSLNYTYIIIGENIALGNFNSSKSLVDAWMNSPGHRANILNKNYTNIGFATKTGTYNSQKVSISAQIFSKPLSGCTGPSNAIKNQLDLYNQTASNLKVKIDSSNLLKKNSSELSQYNSFINSYNNLVSEIKDLSLKYNQQVNIYNNCIKTI
jgi:uncharacterized protein YkwD